MILHCSRELAARLPEVSSQPLEEASPLGSWHGHLFRLGRRQCLMFCHDDSRYLLFLPGLRKAQLMDLRRWHRALYLATLEAQGVDLARLRRVELALGPMTYDKFTDRSVMGTIRVARQDLELQLRGEPDVLALDPVAVSLHLNRRPLTIRGAWVWPHEEMAKRIAAL